MFVSFRCLGNATVNISVGHGTIWRFVLCFDAFIVMAALIYLVCEFVWGRGSHESISLPYSLEHICSTIVHIFDH